MLRLPLSCSGVFVTRTRSAGLLPFLPFPPSQTRGGVALFHFHEELVCHTSGRFLAAVPVG